MAVEASNIGELDFPGLPPIHEARAFVRQRGRILPLTVELVPADYGSVHIPVSGLPEELEDGAVIVFHPQRTHRAPLDPEQAEASNERRCLRNGDLLIDPNLGQATVSGRFVRLSDRELELLLALADRPNQVIADTDLITRVWGEKGKLDVLRTYIARLRNKIGDERHVVIGRRQRGGYFLRATEENLADNHPINSGINARLDEAQDPIETIDSPSRPPLDGELDLPEVGGRVFDLESSVVYMGDIQIKLTDLQRDLLQALLATPNKIVLSQDLMHAAWDQLPTRYALTAAISNLRRKLRDTEQQLIRGRSGKGYYLHDADLLGEGEAGIEVDDEVNKAEIVPGLVINYDLKAVERDRGIHELSEKEFEILDFLVRNPDRVVAPDEIVSAVWGTDYLLTNERAAQNNLRTHIVRLRRKLTSRYESLLETVHGEGYCLHRLKPSQKIDSTSL